MTPGNAYTGFPDGPAAPKPTKPSDDGPRARSRINRPAARARLAQRTPAKKK